jgi:predicted ATPase
VISALHIKGYKSLKDTEIELATDGLTVLVGPNGSGKSTLLEAIASIYELASRDINKTRFAGRNYRNVNTIDCETGVIEFSTELPASDGGSSSRWDFGLQRDVHDNISIIRDDLSRQGSELKRRAHEYHSSATSLRIASHPSASFLCSAIHGWGKSNEAKDWYEFGYSLAESLGPVRLARFSPERIAEPPPTATPVDESGYGLPAALLELQNSSRKRFLDIDARFRKLFPWIEEVQVPPRTVHPKQPSLVDLRFLEQGKTRPCPASDESSGMLLALALLWVTMRPDPDKILCYDEPENSMHPYLLQEVYQLLRRASRGELGGPRIQVIVATQSVDFVNQCRPEEVRICERDDKGHVSVHSIGDMKELQVSMERYRGALGELWYSGTMGGIPRNITGGSG